MKQSILCLYLASIFFTMSCNFILEDAAGSNSGERYSSDHSRVSSSVDEKPLNNTIIDERDAQSYRTTVIGTQTWMAENLNYSANNTMGYCSGETTTENALTCDTYGRLYDWNVAMAGSQESGANPSMVQGICPADWHLPSDSEWDQLMEYVDANNGSEGIGQSLKATTLWSSNSRGGVGTDLFGFSALPAGFGGTNSRGGYYNSLTNYGIHWSTSLSGTKVLRRDLRYSDNELSIDYSEKAWMGSVRCVKNAEIVLY
ncbi:MAG: hypothetical protein OCD01_14695 [Fibrobacterales bacterium]